MSSPEAQTLQSVTELCEGLIEGWKNTRPDEDEFHIRRDKHISQFACVYALSAHTHRVVGAALRLYSEELYLESVPLVRASYEHALTAMWVAQYDDAAPALVNESHRIRKNTVKSARAAWDIVVELAEEADGWEPLQSGLNDTARSVQKICEALVPGGDQAYTIYRLLSSLSHPGAHVIDYYINDEPVAVQKDPKRFERPFVWLFMAACSLVWAGRAVDMLDRKHPRRNELRSAATILGISPELKPKKTFSKPKKR